MPHSPDQGRRPSLRRRRGAGDEEAFSTALFTGVNLAVFLVLAASVAAAGVLYSRGT